MKKKTWFIIVGIVILFGIGMYIVPKLSKSSPNTVSGKESQAKGERGKQVGAKGERGRLLNVTAMIIKPGQLNEVIRTTGTLIPDEEVDLSFETSGKITGLFFTEGTEVKKGALLGKVNDKPLQAELKKLEAQIPLAEDRVFRQKSLLEKDAVSKEAYEQVSTELEKLKADIELVKTRIAQTELRAPFDGMIGLRLVSEGTYASPTTIVSKLIKIRPLKLEFSVNERYIRDIRPGLNLQFEVEGDLNKYSAKVYAVESKVDIKTRTLKVRALYSNLYGALKPGRSAFIEIKLHEINNALMVPNESAIAEMGRTTVYLLKGGKAQQTIIERGLRTESNIQVLSGLAMGDTLITTGVMQLRDGMPVIIEQLISD